MGGISRGSGSEQRREEQGRSEFFSIEHQNSSR
jgi:hypothetical protein